MGGKKPRLERVECRVVREPVLQSPDHVMSRADAQLAKLEIEVVGIHEAVAEKAPAWGERRPAAMNADCHCVSWL